VTGRGAPEWGGWRSGAAAVWGSRGGRGRGGVGRCGGAGAGRRASQVGGGAARGRASRVGGCRRGSGSAGSAWPGAPWARVGSRGRRGRLSARALIGAARRDRAGWVGERVGRGGQRGAQRGRRGDGRGTALERVDERGRTRRCGLGCGAEVSGHLVGSPAFKAGGTGDPRAAGSIPVHLRHSSPASQRASEPASQRAVLRRSTGRARQCRSTGGAASTWPEPRSGGCARGSG
jgi:hypothetical protein